MAIDATRANARANGLGAAIQCERGSLGDAWPFDEPPGESAELLVANISAGALVQLANEIAAALVPSGIFVGSGVIGSRTDEVLVALAAAGLLTEEIRAEGDWRAIMRAEAAGRLERAGP